jgi:hypothetical protein
VQAYDLPRPGGGAGDLHDWDRGRVGRQDRIGPFDHPVKFREQRGLDPRPLRGGLDSQVTVAEITQVDRDRDAPKYRFVLCGERFPALTARASDASIRPRPASAAASSTSRTMTSRPARPQTSAMPDPIRPQLMTPTLAISLNWVPSDVAAVVATDLEARPG